MSSLNLPIYNSDDEHDCYTSSSSTSNANNNYFYGNSVFDSDSHDSGDVSVVTADPDHHLLFTYEVRFKTCTEPFLFHEKLLIGEMVTVQCERGYNIGFVTGEVFPDPDNVPQKRILAKLIDEDNTIKEMLQFKITAEKNALIQCRLHCKGHRLGSFADSIAAEFQFDRKKLTVYLKKYEDVSVCRLVRKLYDTYKMRIKVLEVEDPAAMKEMTKKYLELSKLNIPLSDAFNFDPATSVLALKSYGKNNSKSDKQMNAPNYSKSHLGQSQHLIPSLVQYGPQADKRHNNPHHQQQQHPALYHHYYVNGSAPSSMHMNQPQRSDHRSNYAYAPNHHHAPAAATAASSYGQLQHHTVGLTNQVHEHSNYHHYTTSRHHTPAPPPAPSLALSSFPQQRQSQFERFSYDAYHHSLEPFGHDDSSFSGEASGYQQSNNNLFFSSHSGLNSSTHSKDSSSFPVQDEYLFSGYPQHRGLSSDALPDEIEALTSALARPGTLDKRHSNSSLSSTSPTNSVTSQGAGPSSIFLYPEIHPTPSF
jgi:hypothetical protein